MKLAERVYNERSNVFLGGGDTNTSMHCGFESRELITSTTSRHKIIFKYRDVDYSLSVKSAFKGKT